MPRDVIPQTISPVVEHLEQARARVAEAWIQRHAIRRRADGRFAYCMMGSLYEHQAVDKTVCEQAALVLNEAAGLLTRSNTSTINFNDHWNHTKSDVLQAFDVAIELQLRKEHKEFVE